MLKALGATATMAGIYGAALKMTVITNIFSLSFSPLLLSTLGRVNQSLNPERAKKIARDAMRLVILFLPFGPHFFCIPAPNSETVGVPTP